MLGADDSLADPVPTVIDPSKASIARVYDAALGGKDNYEVDREVLRQVSEVAPEVKQLAVDNCAFLIRAVRFLAGNAGITQFLDCGSGLPTAENTHQVAQRRRPQARVVYVDNDPVVLAHGRALLEDNDHTHFVDADIFRPQEVIGHETVRGQLDFAQPIALLQVGTLHHRAGDPSDLMREYVDALPPGSYVAVAHFLDPETDEHSSLARRMEEQFLHSPMGTGLFRTRDEIRGLLPDLELIEPGLVRCVDWWPNGPRIEPLSAVQHCIAGAVGRKP